MIFSVKWEGRSSSVREGRREGRKEREREEDAGGGIREKERKKGFISEE